VARVGVFQYEWPLQSHTVDFVVALAAETDVDLFLYDCPTRLVDLSRLDSPRIRVIELGPRARRGSPIAIAVTLLERLSVIPTISLAARAARRRMRGLRYTSLVGVEKKGLIWAGLAARGIPLTYFSLELYDEEHPYFDDQPGFAALRMAEKRFHRRAVATIVQDRDRGAHLLRANGIETQPLIFLPVSVRGEPILERGTYLRDKFGIAADRPVILYLGLMDENRHCLDVARMARQHGERFAFVFHGYGEAEFLDRMRNEGGDALILSTDMVSEHELPHVVASADVGLALYRTDCANDRLTAFSSEKVALYCRAGVPFVAFDSESYRALIAAVKCAELTPDPAGIPEAVERILSDYEVYRSGARAAFSRYYRYDANIAKALAQWSAVLTERNAVS
jgi:glycosyltransferase involved in cell wall biosynthesis